MPAEAVDAALPKRPRVQLQRAAQGGFSFVFHHRSDIDDDREAPTRAAAPAPTVSSVPVLPSSPITSMSSAHTAATTAGAMAECIRQPSGTRTALGYFEAVPMEVLLHVLSFMDASDLAGCVPRINHTFRELAEDDSLWRRFCMCSRAVVASLPMLSLVFHGGKGEDGIRWKHVYRYLIRRCVCKRCSRPFRPLLNSEQACIHHRGSWQPSLDADGDRWTCCRRTRKHSPGCTESWHEDACSWGSGLF